MYPTERIVEQYVRIVKRWFTMTNIRYGNNREIDILAVDSKRNAYHVEVDIHKGGLQWGPHGNDGYSVRQYKDKKFNDEVSKFIKREFGMKNVKDIWVCWGIHPKVRDRALKEAKKHNVEIWEFKDKIVEFYNDIGTSSYSDEIIQAFSLLKASKKCVPIMK